MSAVPMEPRSSALSRLVSSIRLWRYKWFGRAPTAKEWEARVRRVVAETVETALPWIPRQGAAFLDVGANIGLFTDGVLRSRPDARAWLFEPVREHYDVCRARFASNPRVVVENFALGDARARTTIFKPKHNPGGNLIEPKIAEQWRNVVDFRTEEIDVRTFDEYAREKGIERIDFVKCDTEGYDYRVLRGMLSFLRSQSPLTPILAEIMHSDIQPEYTAQLEALDELYALGYARVDLTGMPDAQDFLFLPPGAEPPA